MRKTTPRFTGISAIALIAGTVAIGAGPAAVHGANYVVSRTAATARSAPIVISRTPQDGATGVAPSAKVSATLSTDVNPASIQARLTRTGGGTMATAVAYDSGSHIIVITPDNAMATGARYTVTLTGAMSGAGNAKRSTSWEFATTDVAGCPRSIWRDNDTPAVTATTATRAVEVGVKFRADRDGYVTGIRFYKGTGNTGTHVGQLWSWNGEKLAEATFTAETSSGWQQVSFSSPVRIGAGATYVAAYYAPAGHYAYTYDYFASIGRVRPPLTALKNGADGGSSTSSGGIGTIRCHGHWPRSARKHFVKRRAFGIPPSLRM